MRSDFSAFVDKQLRALPEYNTEEKWQVTLPPLPGRDADWRLSINLQNRGERRNQARIDIPSAQWQQDKEGIYPILSSLDTELESLWAYQKSFPLLSAGEVLGGRGEKGEGG